PRELLGLGLNPIEHAAGALENRLALAQRVAGPKQAVEELARVVLHRQRLARDSERMPAAVQIGLRRELETRERRLLADHAGRDLIDRHAGVAAFRDRGATRRV